MLCLQNMLVKSRRQRERERESKRLRRFLISSLLFFSLLFQSIFFAIPSPVKAATTLTTGLVSFWKLDEASGTRADAVGTGCGGSGCNLTDINTVTQAVGKIGNAAQFTSANSEYLTHVDHADLSTGDIDFSASAWVYLDNIDTDQAIVGQYLTSTNQRSWSLNYYSSSKYFRLSVSSDGTATGFNSIEASTFGQIQASTWYFVVVWHDSVNNTINIQVNNGAVDSKAYTTGTLDSNGDFAIGAMANPIQFFNGRIDAVGFWKKVLSSSEKTELYNGGNGLEYPFTVVDTTPPTITSVSSNTANGTYGTGAVIDIRVTFSEAVTSTGNVTVTLETGTTDRSCTFTVSNSSTGSCNYTVVDGDSSSDLDALSIAGTIADQAGNPMTNFVPATSLATNKNIVINTVGSITITSPVNYQVIQRNGSNQANITVTGTYTGTPTAIEASWNSGAYTTIVASPAGGTFSGTISNQTAGQGTLIVRFTNNTSVSSSKSYVGIGDIFVSAGQSNGSGRGLNPQTYSNPTLKASLFGNDDVWKELADPTDSNTNQVDSVSLEVPGVEGGSVWPLIATNYLADQNVPVAFIPTTKGGTSITQWQPNSSNHGDVTTLYGSMYRRINAVGGVKAVLFWQGENDMGTSRATYLSKVTSLANAIYSDFGVKTVVAQIGPYNNQTATNIDNVRLAQIDAWNAGGNILPGPSLYDIQITDLTYYVHFRTDAEVAAAATRWWAAIKKDLYSGTDGRGPILTSAKYNSTKTQIKLTFSDDTLPLLPASNLAGFTVKDNGISASISSITRIANNKLQINLASAASGTITISLGSGNVGEGVSVPTDSSTYNLPAEIFVDQATTALDETPPSGGSVSYNDGYYTSATVNLTVSDGTDAGSGLDTTTRTVQRKSATLSNGACGSYGSFSTITVTGTYPNFTDSSIVSSNCYQYQYFISDNDGNQATYTSSNVVKVDTANPTTPGTPSTTTPTNSSSQTWAWTAATDTVSGIANYLWRTTGTAIVSGSTATNNVITSLTEGIYNFFVKAVDNAGNQGTETLAGTLTVDQTAPTISSVSSGTPTSTGATITWTTNENTSSKIDYGLTNSYGNSTSETDTSPRVSSHSVALSGLVSCSTYHYRVQSIDAATNEKIDNDNTFTTAGCTASSSVSTQTASQITTASGGSLTLQDGNSHGLTLTVPTSFAGSDANFQAHQLDKTTVLATTSNPSGYSAAGSYFYELKALTNTTATVSSFNNALTVTIAYGTSDISGLDESTLKIFRWDGNNWNQLSSCFVNTSAKTVACTTTNFSTFALFGQASSSGSSSSSSSSSWSGSSSVCSDQAPGNKVPWLYGAIAQDSSSVLLYFTEADNPVNKYVLKYGTKSGDYPYGVQDMGINSRGPMTFLVKSLSPNTTYYFKVRGGNGCAVGNWSNEISAKTKGFVTTNNLDFVSSELKPVEETQSKETNSSCQTYLVKSGDTLWSIAKNLLGDGNKYKEIIEQNKEKYPTLETSNSLRTGWELKTNCTGLETEQTNKTTGKTQNSYEVKVKVVDTQNKPVAGAKVTLHSTPREATTDKNGVANFDNVEAGQHQVLIAYDGYKGEQTVNLTGDAKEFDLNVKVQKDNLSISPLAYGIMGIMGLIIIGLLGLLIKTRRKV